jgi:hypothetical protein
MDSGAEKDVIRKASSYLDFLIVQCFRKSTDLFTFAHKLDTVYQQEWFKAKSTEFYSFFNCFGSPYNPFVFVAYLVHDFFQMNVSHRLNRKRGLSNREHTVTIMSIPRQVLNMVALREFFEVLAELPRSTIRSN